MRSFGSHLPLEGRNKAKRLPVCRLPAPGSGSGSIGCLLHRCLQHRRLRLVGKGHQIADIRSPIRALSLSLLQLGKLLRPTAGAPKSAPGRPGCTGDADARRIAAGAVGRSNVRHLVRPVATKHELSACRQVWQRCEARRVKKRCVLAGVVCAEEGLSRGSRGSVRTAMQVSAHPSFAQAADRPCVCPRTTPSGTTRIFEGSTPEAANVSRCHSDGTHTCECMCMCTCMVWLPIRGWHTCPIGNRQSLLRTLQRIQQRKLAHLVERVAPGHKEQGDAVGLKHRARHGVGPAIACACACDGRGMLLACQGLHE